MTETEYIAEFRRRWPDEFGQEAATETLVLADEAVRAFPRSARLWDTCGDLIQLSPGTTPHSLGDALDCYRRAIGVDPEFATAWESIGHYYDAVLDNENAAGRYFARAAWLRRC